MVSTRIRDSSDVGMVGTMREPVLTEAEVWMPLYVANTEEEARAQAGRQFAMVDLRLVRVTHLTGQIGDTGWMDFFLEPPGAIVRVVDMFEDSEWSDGELIAEWRVKPSEDMQVITTTDGDKIRLIDIDYLGYTAPGIGTVEGFAHHDQKRLVMP